LTSDESYIKYCIEIAKNGLGTTRPNPMVGCVIVFEEKIIGQGFTSPYGGNHAEVNAINSVKNKTLLSQSTLYVTLEPCSHFGKTPPCSDLIIKYEIPRVVIGCQDDNPEVAGKGIAKLKSSGCQVTLGVLEAECQIHHKRFFTYHNKKRPYIILKWAETIDGFIAPESKDEKKPVWITNSFSRQLAHKWRTEEHAILVGTNTVLEDNPKLTSRDWEGNNPIRVVIDMKNKLSKTSFVFNDEAQTIRINDQIINSTKLVAGQISKFLHKKGVQSVIVEGGTTTLQTFIDEDLWDEARVFTGNIEFGRGLSAPKFKGNLKSTQRIKDDVLKIYTND